MEQLTNPLNITHINSYYFSNRLHPLLIEKLCKENIFQHVFIPVNSEEPVPEDYKTEFENASLSTYPCFNNIERKIWLIKMYKVWRAFKKFSGNQPASLNHAHTLIVNGLIAFLDYKKHGTPYLVTIRNTDVNIFLKKSFIFRWLGLIILTNAKAIITLSPAYWDIQLKSLYSFSIIQKLETKHNTIPNGIDDFWINNIYKPKSIDSTIELLFVGRIDRNKNLITLLKATRVLHSRGIKVHLTVLGSGPLENEMKQFSCDLPIDFEGFIGDKKVLLDFYRKANIVVVPSKTESFGLVYAEAMTQGNPVIYSKGQGFDGFFEDGIVGFAVNYYDVDEIVEKVIKISKDYSFYSANAILQAPKFNWSIQIEKLSEAYINLH